MEYAIQAEKIYKSYKGVQAVKGISFCVEKATCFGLLGPNGAGKTTLMKILYGKAERDQTKETQINVLGYDPLFSSLEIRALSGVVPQEDNLDISLNVYQNLMIFSRYYGMSRKKADRKINELLDFLELSEKKYSFIQELSGGMKRRVSIARALLHQPQLLFLDEPTTGLDPQVRHLIWEKLRQLKKKGVTILLTTHYMEEAYQICDQILIMDQGKKVMEGNPQELLTNHIEKYVLEIFEKKYLPNDPSIINNSQIRIDQSENFIFLHSDDFTLLQTLSQKIAVGNCYLRQANLEDLFLKITGRRLNDSQ